MSKESIKWTSVIKKLIYISLIIGIIIVIIKMAIFYMPFLIAFIISILMEPAIKKIMNKFEISRKLSSIIIFIIVLGVILGLLIWGIITIISEANNLLSNFNEYYENISAQFQSIIENFKFDNINISSEIKDIIQDAINSVLEKSSLYLQKALSNLIKIVTSIPTIAIYFGVTILSIYFICTDRIYMIDEIEHHLPEKWAKEMNIHFKEITKTLGRYLKAQLTLILISFAISIIGLYIMSFVGLNVGFPLLIALGIAFVDALPILGSGTVMVPWAIVSGLNGDLNLGIAIIVLWIIMSITRQFIEPKILSRKHPGYILFLQ